jgi:hypothetical protein
MACRGWYTALTMHEATCLLSLDVIDARVELLDSLYQNADADARILLVDKSWDAMHRVLCDGWLDAKHGDEALRSCVIGGKQLSNRADWIISFAECDLVKRISAAIDAISEDSFREKYFRLDRMPSGFFVHRYEGEIGDLDFEYTWGYFEDVRHFYRVAGKRDLACVFAVDQ